MSQQNGQCVGEVHESSPRMWDIAAIACIGGCAVWAWLTWQQALLNKDGVRYVTAAEAILQGDWQALWHAYPWPFQPALMAGVHLLTGLHLETAGYLLNLLFYLAAIVTFLAILRELGASRIVLMFGAGLLLLHPDLNATLPGIYRDQGYWAFFLLGLWLFLRFHRLGWWRYAIGTSAALFVATLFRIEGLIILMALPLAALANHDLAWTKRLQRLGKAATVPLLMIVLGGAFIATDLFQAELVTETRFQEPFERVARLWHALADDLPAQSDRLSEAVLNRHSDRHAFGALLAAYAYVLIASTLRGVNWLYLLLVPVTLLSRSLRPARHAQPVLLWLVVVYAGILAAYMLHEHFVSHRYAAGLAFIVMIYASFGLASLFETFCERHGRPFRENWSWIVAMVALAIVGFDGLIRTGPSNFHERQAGEWLRDNVPHELPIFTDSTRMRYYAGRPYVGGRDSDWPRVQRVIKDQPHERFRYMAFNISRHTPENLALATQSLDREPVVSFGNRRGDMTVIYRLPDPGKPAPPGEGE